jgi:hypothetical protein
VSPSRGLILSGGAHGILWSDIVLLEQAQTFPTPAGNDDGNIIRSTVTNGLLDQLIGGGLRGLFEDEALRRGYHSFYLCTNVKLTANQVLYPEIGYLEYGRKFDQGCDRIFHLKKL